MQPQATFFIFILFVSVGLTVYNIIRINDKTKQGIISKSKKDTLIFLSITVAIIGFFYTSLLIRQRQQVLK